MQKGKTFFECLFENIAFSFSNEVIRVDVANRQGDSLGVKIKLISGKTVEFSPNVNEPLQLVKNNVERLML